MHLKWVPLSTSCSLSLSLFSPLLSSPLYFLCFAPILTRLFFLPSGFESFACSAQSRQSSSPHFQAENQNVVDNSESRRKRQQWYWRGAKGMSWCNDQQDWFCFCSQVCVTFSFNWLAGFLFPSALWFWRRTGVVWSWQAASRRTLHGDRPRLSWV